MLLKTRFYIPPLRRNIVQREPLLRILSGSEGGQLVLVSAPAGYGKTTLVSQWLHHFPHTFSWLVLDAAQSAPRIFWRYVITALNQAQPGCGEQSLQILQNRQDGLSLENALIALLNALDAISPPSPQAATTLVLDDFHLVSSPELNDQLSSVLNHLPPSLRIVITSRSLPDLALAKRRASNQLIEIGQQQLSFSDEDSNRFLQQTMELQISPGESRQYCQETEGWIAGLQLIGLSLQKHHTELPSGDPHKQTPATLHRDIADYLFDEVFALQSDDVKEFLLLSSAVPRFTAGLCNELTGRHDSLAVLATLDRHNLFLLPLDNHGVWFRYHDLFRRFLLQHFHQLNSATQNGCHQRASDWFEQNGYLQEALEQALQQQNWQQAEALLLQLEASDEDTDARLPQWLARFPAEHPLRQRLSAGTTKQPPAYGFDILLTAREQQVLDLVASGCSNKEIARQLHISLNTLKVHIRNLYGKIGVETRSEALHKLIQSGQRSS